MGLREWWGRLVGDNDRLEREEDAIRNRTGDEPAPLEDFEGIKEDTRSTEYDLPGEEAAVQDEEGI
jgi:hypothetical protein